MTQAKRKKKKQYRKKRKLVVTQETFLVLDALMDLHGVLKDKEGLPTERWPSQKQIAAYLTELYDLEPAYDQQLVSHHLLRGAKGGYIKKLGSRFYDVLKEWPRVIESN